MNLSENETSAYAGALLSLGLRVSKQEFRTMETVLAEDGRSVVMVVSCDDGHYETSGFELDRTMTENEFHKAWNQTELEMNLHLADIARNAAVELIAALIDLGPGPGRIELVSEDETVLAVLQFSKPSTASIEDGTLTFGPIVQGKARASGRAIAAHICDSNGQEVFSCDVTDYSGEGVIKLSNNKMEADAPVSINSFLLTYPA